MYLGVALMLGVPIAAGESPRIWRSPLGLQKDVRRVIDRLHARNNRDHEDNSFLNAVGAVWPADIARSAAGYMASTGFLIDRCHVLTNLHAVYIDDLVFDPAPGKEVFFAVGQTDGNGNRGALQGLQFLLSGNVIAHGDAVIIDRFPLYGDFDVRRHLVIGMHQGIRGNGIDVSEEMPNIQLFFTPGTLANIRAAQAGSPCPASWQFFMKSLRLLG